MGLPKVNLLQAQSWESNPGLLESLLILSVHPLYSSLSHVFFLHYGFPQDTSVPFRIIMEKKEKGKTWLSC